MQALTEAIWKLKPPSGLFNQTVVANCFPNETPAAHRNLVYRAKQAGEISIIRKGLYILEPAYRQEGADPIVIAPLIYGPSYVSFESALRFHGIIPDIVQTTSSATSLRSRTFATSTGYFDFKTVPVSFFFAGVRLISYNVNNKPLLGLVASPVRALADLLYTRRDITWEKDGPAFLEDSLRIDLKELEEALNQDELDEVKETFSHKRVCKYLNELQCLFQGSSKSEKFHLAQKK